MAIFSAEISKTQVKKIENFTDYLNSWGKRIYVESKSMYIPNLRCMGRTVHGEDINEEINQGAIKEMADMVNHLAEQAKLEIGVMCPLFAMELAGKKKRYMLLLYVYSPYTKKELNEELGKIGFFEEGDLPEAYVD